MDDCDKFGQIAPRHHVMPRHQRSGGVGVELRKGHGPLWSVGVLAGNPLQPATNVSGLSAAGEHAGRP
jgi:hypothetical protein